MRTKVIQFYQDPGHGWAKVSLKELEELEISDQISSFSYKLGNYGYLEEDCDLVTYMRALEKKGYNKTNIRFVEHVCRVRQSKIRSYPPFRKFENHDE